MKDISLKQRLIIPIALLGMVALLSNILSLINIHNVNANAANIADNYMDGKSRLAKISQSSMNIHKMALSHIVATDYNTMILLVQQIKEEEALLDDMLAEYENYVIHSTNHCCPIMPLSNTHWSIWSVPVQGIKHRMPIFLPTGMWPLMPEQWEKISTP